MAQKKFSKKLLAYRELLKLAEKYKLSDDLVRVSLPGNFRYHYVNIIYKHPLPNSFIQDVKKIGNIFEMPRENVYRVFYFMNHEKKELLRNENT